MARPRRESAKARSGKREREKREMGERERTSISTTPA
jgi:hypothetical protein